MRRRYVSAHLLITVCLSMSYAVNACDTITDKDRIKLEGYIKTWYKLPDKQSVTLVDSDTVDAACYRKLVFRASAPAPLLILYLAPDGRHLMSNVMDLAVDPIVAQHKRRNELQGLLTSGALLTSPGSNAHVSMVVFSDFQCPYCKRFSDIVSELSPEERKKLRITYRQLPLNIHEWAEDAAALSACTALQEKAAFWRLHDFFFAKQQELSKDTLTTKALGFLGQEGTIDIQKIKSCLADRAYVESLRLDSQLATDLGINATPTVFLDGRKTGIRSIEDLRAAITSAEAENGRNLMSPDVAR